MEKGNVFVARVVDGVPVAVGPAHADLTKAKAWARRAGFTEVDKVAFCEVRSVASVKPRLVDLDFGDDAGPEDPVPVQA